MNESNIWSYLKRVLGNVSKKGTLDRHEDHQRVGMTDVSLTIEGLTGFLELKAYENWPANPDACPRFSNLRPAQRTFIRRRWRAGAHIGILVAFGEELMLLPGSCIDMLGSLTREQLLERAIWKGDKKLTDFWSNFNGDCFQHECRSA